MRRRGKRLRSPRLIDLFSGAGGFTWGFAETGFRPVYALDIDRWAVASYQANFGPHAVCGPIESVRHFPDAEVVIGGPPCQGFSQLGKHAKNDPRNKLWEHYYRAINQVRPLFFVMENVPQLLKSDEFIAFEQKARRLGYDIAADILNAADYGVPQRRKRAIVIGALACKASLPSPTHINPAKTDLFAVGRALWVSVKEAIGDLPLIPDGENWHIGRNPTPKSVERYRHVPEGGNRWDLPRSLMPACWIRKVSGGTDLFGRLWWNQPAFTVRTEFFKPEKGRYLHPQADRPITHREAARLQTFPDDFVFKGSKIQVAKQIGNAVPPRLAQAIAGHVRALVAECNDIGRA